MMVLLFQTEFHFSNKLLLWYIIYYPTVLQIAKAGVATNNLTTQEIVQLFYLFHLLYVHYFMTKINIIP